MDFSEEFKFTSYKQPVFNLVGKNNSPIKCLYDTGASITVFNGSVAEFKSLFSITAPIEDSKLKFLLSSFDKSAEEYNVYYVDFHIGVFNFMHIPIIFICKRNLSYKLILAGSIFGHGLITLDYKNCSLHISDTKSDIFGGVSKLKSNDNFVDKTYVFCTGEMYG